jgi:hypothetical protein
MTRLLTSTLLWAAFVIFILSSPYAAPCARLRRNISRRLHRLVPDLRRAAGKRAALVLNFAHRRTVCLAIRPALRATLGTARRCFELRFDQFEGHLPFSGN